jgi:hypothetical protein
MNIFSSNYGAKSHPPRSQRFKAQKLGGAKLKGAIRSNKRPRVGRPSDEEIRQKIKEIEDKKKASYPTNLPNKKGPIDTDPLSNDPRRPETRGKLMAALNNSSFPFNPKEREVLSKILGKK